MEPTLFYQGSLTYFHGPAEMLDASEWPHLYQQGRYTVLVINPHTGDQELLARVRPESLIIQHI